MGTLSLAARNLTRRRRRSLVSGGALALGVAAVLVLRGTTGGIQQLNLSMLVDGHLGAVQVHRAGYLAAAELHSLTLDFEDSPDLRRRVRSVPGVRAVAPRISFGAAFAPAGDREAATVVATAVDPQLERTVGWRRASWASAWFGAPAEPAVVLDADLADSLGVGAQAAGTPEDQLAGLLATDRTDALSGELVRVIGTLANGLPGDRRTLLVTLGLAQRLLKMEGRATEYVVAIDRLDDAPLVAARLAAALGPGFEVHAWDERAPFLRDVHQGQDVFGVVLAMVVLLVVVLGVANALFMNVVERVPEVGTMLALGMRRAAIVRLFLAEGLILAVLGVSLGVALGLGAVALLASHGVTVHTPGTTLEQVIAPTLTVGWTLFTALAALSTAALASLWAARRAARLSPVEALRDA